MSKDKFELRPTFFSQPFTLAIGTQYVPNIELGDETAEDDWSAADLLGRAVTAAKPLAAAS